MNGLLNGFLLSWRDTLRKLNAIRTVLFFMYGRAPEHWEIVGFYQRHILRVAYDGDKILYGKGI